MIYVALFDFSPAMMKSMGDRLREARSKKFESATKAAEALGMPPSTYRAYENGQNSFGPEEAERFARKFGSTAAYLLIEDAGAARSDPQDSVKKARNVLRLWKLFGQFSEMDPGDQAQIIDVLESRLRGLNPRHAQRSRSRIGG